MRNTLRALDMRRPIRHNNVFCGYIYGYLPFYVRIVIDFLER